MRDPLTRARDDAGVVAIVMTLAISTFLLGVAALAVDLGRAYLRQNDLQSLADRLALAGAKGLPTITEPEGALNQVLTTLNAICEAGEEQDELCGVSAAQWTDGDPGNGEITFFADADNDGEVTLADAVAGLSTPSQALRVVLPPSTVQFGLAGLLGFSSAQIQRSATARIGTPLGSGILPFALTPEQVAAGRFCVAEGATAPAPSTFASAVDSAGSVRLTLNTAFPQGLPTAGAAVSFRVSVTNQWRSPRGTAFQLKKADGTSVTPAHQRTGWRTYRLDIPPGPAGSTIQVWAKGRLGRDLSAPFTTNVINLTYAGTAPGTDPAPGTGACENGLGLAQLPGLEQLIRTGSDVDLGGVLNLGAANGFSEALHQGLLEPSGNVPGRLIGNTGNDTESVNGYDIDATDLFSSPHLLDPIYAGSSGKSLKELLQVGTAAEPANRGWITSAAVRSHRLAVLPVIDPEPLGDENGYRITSYRYVWIDSDSTGRGLLWKNGRLTGIEGYVIDPGFLPAVTSGSGTVGPYLGPEMPREALLLTDLGSSPA